MPDQDVEMGKDSAGAIGPKSFLGRLLDLMGFGADSQPAMQQKRKIVQDGSWEIVAETFGLMDAHIIIGRLQAEDIPARAWQEGAGRALGITIGKLGTAYIEVPPEFVEQAEAILELDFSDDFEDEV